MNASGQHIITRLTQKFGMRVPIVSAPMAGAAPGLLAAAVSDAGGLGLIGGGYCDIDIKAAFEETTKADVGIGFITWKLAERPEILHKALAYKPKAVMLSFGDPRPFAPAIAATGTPLICQCQNLSHVKDALQADAAVIVAQGSEAGGHGATRGTMSFVAEVASYLKVHSPDTLLLAAGGIADGRGVAAALMLGADGVLMGSRFWASAESKVLPSLLDAAISADGDATVRTSVPDLARGFNWPQPFNIRTLQNSVIRDFAPRQEEVRSDDELRKSLKSRYSSAAAVGDADNTGVVVGEAAGLIHDRPSAEQLVNRILAEAVECLSKAEKFLSRL